MLVLQGPKQAVGRVVLSPSGFGLVAELKGKAVYWPAFGAATPRVFRPLRYRGIDLAADGKHLLACTNRGLRIYAPNDFEGKRFPGRAVVSSFACSPTESLVIVRMQRGGRWSGWRIGPQGEWEALWEGDGGSVFRPLFSRDGSLVVQHVIARRGQMSGTVERDVVETYDARNGRLVESTANAKLIFHDAALSPDAQLIANLFAKEVVVYARASGWQRQVLLPSDSRKHFTCAAFHPSGRYLAVTSKDETVKLYDTTSWEVARTFTWNIGRMRSIAFSPDGTLAAAGSDTGKVVVWDVDL